MINIIMCTYNGEKYIAEQLQSIMDNTFSDWKLYIYDDQSTDGTESIVDKFIEKYGDKIIFITNKMKKGAIKNFLTAIYEIGCNMCSDDYIMLCDQDDVWNRDKIQKTYTTIKNFEKTTDNRVPLLVCTDVTVVDEKLQVINDSFRRMNNYNINSLDFSHIIMENKVQGCTAMLNKSLAEMLYRLPDKATMHDGWLALIASAFGKIYYIDEPTMLYRQHSNNVQGSIEYSEDVKNKLANLGEQRKIVFNTTYQIREFADIYKDKMPVKICKSANAFANLPNQGWIKRRYSIIRYKMWKSGFMRNAGLMFLI